MQLSVEFAVSIVIQLLTAGIFTGGLVASINGIKEDIKRLETKQDKHNNLIERMVVVEQFVKSAHHRINDFMGDERKCPN